MLGSRKIVLRSSTIAPWEPGTVAYGRAIRHVRDRDAEGSTTLGIALGYLLVLAAGAVVALLALVWLFGDAPGEGTRTGQETVEWLRSTDRFGTVSIPSASAGPEHSEDEAA